MAKGQYYDPATGRFLTRGVNPDQGNPYVPWRGNPVGVMFAPLALLGMVYGGKKKRGKWDQWVILLVLCGAVGMSLSACGVTDGTNTVTITPLDPSSPSVTPNYAVAVTTPSGTAIYTLTPTETPEPSCPEIFANSYSYDRNKARDFALKYKDKSTFAANGYPTDPESDCTNFVSYALREGGFIPHADWTEGSETWINTPKLFDYLQTIGFTPGTQFYATPDVIEGDHLLLRTHTQDTNDYVQLIIGPDRIGKPLENYFWPQFIESNGNIEVGDLVFYMDTSYSETWTHVAIVTGKGAQTTWANQVTNENLQEPLVVDHDGPREITPEQLPRSVSDTINKEIRSVLFMHAPSLCP